MTVRTTVFNELRNPGTPLLAELTLAGAAAGVDAVLPPGVLPAGDQSLVGELGLLLVLGELDESLEFMAFSLY